MVSHSYPPPRSGPFNHDLREELAGAFDLGSLGPSELHHLVLFEGNGPIRVVIDPRSEDETLEYYFNTWARNPRPGFLLTPRIEAAQKNALTAAYGGDAKYVWVIS